MSDKFTVKTDTTLMPFLTAQLQGWSRNTIKQRLKNGCVIVNDNPVTRHNQALQAGDQVIVAPSGQVVSGARQQLEILYQDQDLVAINKPAGLLSVSSPGKKEPHALGLLRGQLSRRNRPVKLWPVHRIDRDTSGVLLFATSRKMREAVMAGWKTAEKVYLAIVEGCPKLASGTVDQPLRLDPDIYQMHVGPHPDAKQAITHYTVERRAAQRSLLRVMLETGRQHQIRAHMAWLGHPVIGDERYGTVGPRMGLHASLLGITKPGTGKRLVFEAPAPPDFLPLLR